MGAAHLVLLISLIPTIIAFNRVRVYVQEQDQARLNQLVQNSRNNVDQELHRHIDALRQLAGVLSTTGFSEKDWGLNLENSALFQRHLSLRSIGYFGPLPSGTTSTNTVIEVGEENTVPFHRLFFAEAPRAFAGPSADNGRTKALFDQSTAAGTVIASQIYTVPVRPGPTHLRVLDFAIPVIDSTVEPATRLGFLRCTVEIDGLLQAAFEDKDAALAVELFDDAKFSEISQTTTQPTAPLRVAGQIFGLRYEKLPRFAELSQTKLPRNVLITGLAINFLLFSIAWVQGRGRLEAEKLTTDLRSVQERDRMLERASNDAIWDWNLSNGSLVWNEAVQVMFRYSAEQVSNQLEWWTERLHPDDRRRVLNRREMAVQTGGEFWADEFRFRRGDGTYASVIDRGYIMHDRQGLAMRMIGSMVDITSQKETEEARQESERKLALHIQRTPLAVIEWNLDFKVTAWNPAAERIFGYSGDVAIGKSGSDLIVHDPTRNPNPFLFSNILAGESFPEDVRVKVNETWREVLHQAASDNELNSGIARRSINAFSVANRTADGGSIICDWYNTPLVDANGQVVGIASLVLDVSARKEAEDALAAEKERLAVTVRSIGDGVIATDTDGRINLINKQAEDLTGWKQGEAMGQPLNRIFNVIDQRTRTTYRNPLSHVLSSGEIVDLPDSSVLINRDGSGEKVIGASAAPIHDQESQIVGAVLVFRDITEEQSIAEERLRASKLDSLGILAGGIAHDFNNILTAVIGNLSFARMFSDPAEKLHVRLEEAEKAATRARDLATQLLTFSKGGSPVRQTASLTELLQDSTSFALRGSNVRCEFRADDDLWPVEVDQGQISQVAQNLVINAVQAMPGGGVVKVTAMNIRLDGDSALPLPFGRYTRITVKDQGLGIQPTDLAHVFDPYFTTKEKGTGLGLATSYSIVKRHDGLITVDSTIGKGTEFHIHLPASDNEAPVIVADKDEPLEGHGRVLVMDDEEIIRELAITSLEFLGYRVDAVADGAKCIQTYQEALSSGDPYLAVIMDLTIPGGMGGVEAIGHLREIDPDVPAIVSSGYSSGPIMANHEKHGFKGVVAKPYKIEDLARALSTLIKNGSS
jgi:PAS domain S-box-containing protein